MKKFYSFFLVAVCLFATSFAYAATRTVYFQDNYSWANNGGIYIYLKSSSDATHENAQEPGVAVTENVATNLYKFTIEDDTFDKLKFSNNGNWPTGELDIVDNGVYKSDGYYTKFVPVCFDNFKSDWENVKIHNWGQNVVGPLQLETKGNVYSWLVSEGTKFIFYTGDWAAQTGDLTDYNQIYYYGGSFPCDVYALGKIGLEGASEATSWNPDNGDFKLSYLGKGVYEINNIQMFEDGKDGETSYSKFRFHTALNSDWNNSGTHYRPTEDKILNIGTGTSTTGVTTDGTGDKSWKVVTALAKNSVTGFNTYYVYDLKLDLFNNELTIDGTKHTTGVESISVEDSTAPVEYFNLQGVRVENPENGLYIVRQGNKVSKQLIR